MLTLPTRLSYRSVMAPAVVVYLVAVSLLSVWRGLSVSPDYFVFFTLLGAVALGRWKSFVVDWFPFMFLVLGYEVLRGLAGASGMEVHYTGPIDFDSLIGRGTVPTIWLQRR
jgi:hypothetical protein